MQQIIVRYLTGADAGLVLRFGIGARTVLTIGRHPDCDIPLDPLEIDQVSRRHAEIVARANSPILADLVDRQSTNGTYLNARRVRGSISLLPGDRIRLGAEGPELEFDLGGG